MQVIGLALDQGRVSARRAASLLDMTVDDAVAFFQVSEMELHDILCFCHHGGTMAAEAAAARVRAASVYGRRRARHGKGNLKSTR